MYTFLAKNIQNINIPKQKTILMTNRKPDSSLGKIEKHLVKMNSIREIKINTKDITIILIKTVVS